jgi:type I restriction enzyme, S subunit
LSLPEGWIWASWEQLSVRVTVGYVGPMKSEYRENGVPFLRSQNVRENRFDSAGLLYVSLAFHRKISKSALHSGDLVVVRSGSVGVTCVIPEGLGEANCSDVVVIQRPVGIESAYGAYYMNSLARRAIAAGQVGIALTHFNTRSVAALGIAVPPLEEQRRIVAEVERRLSTIDEIEAVVAANLKRAERLRQAILKRAFEGKLVPQDPNDEPASVLLERIRAEREEGGKARGNGRGRGRGKDREPSLDLGV